MWKVGFPPFFWKSFPLLFWFPLPKIYFRSHFSGPNFQNLGSIPFESRGRHVTNNPDNITFYNLFSLSALRLPIFLGFQIFLAYLSQEVIFLRNHPLGYGSIILVFTVVSHIEVFLWERHLSHSGIMKVFVLARFLLMGYLSLEALLYSIIIILYQSMVLCFWIFRKGLSKFFRGMLIF